MHYLQSGSTTQQVSLCVFTDCCHVCGVNAVEKETKVTTLTDYDIILHCVHYLQSGSTTQQVSQCAVMSAALIL